MQVYGSECKSPLCTLKKDVDASMHVSGLRPWGTEMGAPLGFTDGKSNHRYTERSCYKGKRQSDRAGHSCSSLAFTGHPHTYYTHVYHTHTPHVKKTFSKKYYSL